MQRTPKKYQEAKLRGVLPVEDDKVGVSFDTEDATIMLRLRVEDVETIHRLINIAPTHSGQR